MYINVFSETICEHIKFIPKRIYWYEPYQFYWNSFYVYWIKNLLTFPWFALKSAFICFFYFYISILFSRRLWLWLIEFLEIQTRDLSYILYFPHSNCVKTLGFHSFCLISKYFGWSIIFLSLRLEEEETLTYRCVCRPPCGRV